MCRFDDDPPQRWYECDDCSGEGGHEESRPSWDDPYGAIWVKCERCKGAGGFLDDETPDGPEGPCPPVQMQEGECPF